MGDCCGGVRHSGSPFYWDAYQKGGPDHPVDVLRAGLSPRPEALLWVLSPERSPKRIARRVARDRGRRFPWSG
jgi:hypothetical protein